VIPVKLLYDNLLVCDRGNSFTCPDKNTWNQFHIPEMLLDMESRWILSEVNTLRFTVRVQVSLSIMLYHFLLCTKKKKFLCLRFVIVVTLFRVTTVTNCRALTRFMNVKERAVFLCLPSNGLWVRKILGDNWVAERLSACKMRASHCRACYKYSLLGIWPM
jgi:hypothetical protein